eukprot:GHVL01006997.1.p1 GENE.GHVL01006997.1~~GHVL01006997.1.p1  ORF type:complete len:304 (+),score=48.07 GHVL01006997.1:475-1386(+)
MSNCVVYTMYKFVQLENFKSMKQPLLNIMLENMVLGDFLLALEGINGTIAGTQEGVDAVLNFIKNDPRLEDIIHKISYYINNPFKRAKVYIKKEIVTLGIEGLDPIKCGIYVKPKDWNNLILNSDILLIDTRNEYEIQIGKFKNAINPKTKSFRQFPEYVKNNLSPDRHKKIAMYCTGGIRCEKSTAYLKQRGFEEVYHLEGGILKYLEEVPKDESLWEGECFVFDSRVAVNHILEKGEYDKCYACRRPITKKDKIKPEYQQGVFCHNCIGEHTTQQQVRFLEREKQIRIGQHKTFLKPNIVK